jgi:hypothetical protein
VVDCRSSLGLGVGIHCHETVLPSSNPLGGANRWTFGFSDRSRSEPTAGDAAEQGEILNYLFGALFHSSLHAVDVICRAEAYLESASQRPLGQVNALMSLGVLHAMHGNFDEAHRLRRRAKDVGAQYDLKWSLGRTANGAGWIYEPRR